MKIEQANNIATHYFRSRNPIYWDGQGERPSSVNSEAWAWPMTNNVRLVITLTVCDGKWCHLCKLINVVTGDVLKSFTSKNTVSIQELVGSIMQLCSDYSVIDFPITGSFISKRRVQWNFCIYHDLTVEQYHSKVVFKASGGYKMGPDVYAPSVTKECAAYIKQRYGLEIRY